MTALACCSGIPGRSSSYPLPCQLTFESRDWAQVAETCRPLAWSGRARLGEAWGALNQGDAAQALAILEELTGTDAGTDAAYLAGYIRAGNDEQDAGRVLLVQALIGYRFAGRHADASRAADTLSRSFHEESRFDDELEMAQLAVDEAQRSGNLRAQGRAERTLAEIYDSLGMVEAARDHFFRAEWQLREWPDELAFAYFKHGVFLLDLGESNEIRSALSFLARAAEQVAGIPDAERTAAVRELDELSIPLNRADGFCQLGDPDAADRELTPLQENTKNRSKLRLVKGYVAACRNDLESAVRLFSEAGQGTLEPDYRWRVSLEIARLHRKAGRMNDAERAYRAAIDTIERLRGNAAAVELRPWVLARRMPPYYELLSLLVEQRRGMDALAVAESLHARSWLDTVLSRDPGGLATEAQALKNARIQQRLTTSTARPLSGPELMNVVGAREVLVFVTAGPTTWRAHVASGQVEFQQLPASTAATVAAYRVRPEDPAAAEQAAAALIPDNLQRGEQPLYIVASGMLAGHTLADMMFAGLRRGGRYLIEDRPIAYLPGLAALRCAPGPWEEERRIFVGDSRDDLPAARWEVTKLATARNASPSVGAAATRAMVLRARQASLLHMAVHGSSTRFGRAIALVDGELTAADVLDLGLRPRLAVLTGCATAIGLDRESWGAFPSAFLAAGSRHVIATLRSVEDDQAAVLTQAFYAQPAGRSPIHSLAAAQRQLVGKLPVAAWASFGAWGDAECPP